MIQQTIFGSYEVITEEDGETVVLFEGTFAECEKFLLGDL